jgi:hypothetical protein
MLLVVAAVLAVGAVLLTLLVRSKDLPEAEPVSPVEHLEGLRDLQFEFRLGKLSEEDYQRTKLELQKDLARVLAEIDAVAGKAPARTPPKPPPPASPANTCPHCGARFEKPMKFCGECGKPMTEEIA